MGIGPEDPRLNPGNEPEDEVSSGAADAQGKGLTSSACQLV